MLEEYLSRLSVTTFGRKMACRAPCYVFCEFHLGDFTQQPCEEHGGSLSYVTLHLQVHAITGYTEKQKLPKHKFKKIN